MTDIWVCGTCHSINRQRNDKCYKCGAKQDMSASGPLADLRTERAIAQRAAKPYRSSLIFAVIAGAFIALVAALNVIVLNEYVAAYRTVRDLIPDLVGGSLSDQEWAQALVSTVVPEVVLNLTAIIALFTFALWLSRVVANIPALGGGTASVSSTRAFVTPLIPIYNLFKTPPIIQQALYKTDPRAGGFFMIAVAWVGLVGSWLVGWVFGWWLNLRIASIAFNATSVGQVIDEVIQAFDLAVIVDIITTLMVVGGAIVLVIVMFRIESRARARDREIRSGAKAMVAARAAEFEEDLARQRALAAEQAAGPVSAGFVSPQPGAEATPFEVPRRAPVVADSSATGVVASPPPPWPASPADAAVPPAVPPTPQTPEPPLEQVGTTIAATALGASPSTERTSVPEPAPSPAPVQASAGPRLRLTVSGSTITGSLDGDTEEPATLDELRLAAPALVEAAGTATVVIADAADDAAAELAAEIITVMRAAGVPTTLA